MSLTMPVQDELPNECPKCRSILQHLMFGELFCLKCGYYSNQDPKKSSW